MVAAASEIAHGAEGGGVVHPGVDRGALRLRPEQPGRGDESAADEIHEFQNPACASQNQTQRLVIPEIVELAFIRRIKAGDGFGSRIFLRPPGALVEEAVDHNLVSPRLPIPAARRESPGSANERPWR